MKSIKPKTKNILFQPFLGFLFSLISFHSFAQSFSSNNPGLFGIDGDLYSDYVMNGTFTAAGSHDWFFKTGGTGMGVFDTSNTFYAKSQLSQGINYSFTKKMAYPPYSTQGGMIFLDATYVRDYLGTGLGGDKTVFAPGNNSTMDPTTWATQPTGGNVTNSSDILDGFVHMRRLSNTSNHLIAYLGASTLATTGVRYFDFEFFKTKLGYDTTTGIFSNSGSSLTGGHSIWTFNTDGSINTFGDLILSFSFTTTAVSSIDIWIWVPFTIYNTTIPSGFDFSTGVGTWAGITPNGGYGYAHIQPKAGTSFPAWGMVSSDTTIANSAPPWGSNSKELGTLGNADYYYTKYSNGQFGEAAIDLTTMGIDFSTNATAAPCMNPYTRILIKTRATSSFTSALQDFVGPLSFLDAPSSSASFTAGSILNCNQTSTTLLPTVGNNIVNYSWSTKTGSILGRTDTSFAIATKPGTYYLNVSNTTCKLNVNDSMVVLQDINKPIATANYLGSLTMDTTVYVTLKGGDTTASNYMTPFGRSKGLLWNWAGPNSFTSTIENPTTNKAGTYNLTITEKRNGCTAFASTFVISPFPVLAETTIDVVVTYHEVSSECVIQWNTWGKRDFTRYEVQKSYDGVHFNEIGFEDDDNVNGHSFSDHNVGAPVIFYRIKAIGHSKTKYSSIARVQTKYRENLLKAVIKQNSIDVTFVAEQNGIYIISVYNTSGQLMTREIKNLQEGPNQFNLPSTTQLKNEIYLISLNNKKGDRVLKACRRF
ncbi:MAG: hypothetical protein NVS9B7_21990 [Flavisolibacter sp.]